MPQRIHPPPTTVEVDGTKLRILRIRQGDVLKQFAEKAGISFGFLSQIELGHRPSVSGAVYNRLCDALGLVADDDRTNLMTAAARRRYQSAMERAA